MSYSSTNFADFSDKDIQHLLNEIRYFCEGSKDDLNLLDELNQDFTQEVEQNTESSSAHSKPVKEILTKLIDQIAQSQKGNNYFYCLFFLLLLNRLKNTKFEEIEMTQFISNLIRTISSEEIYPLLFFALYLFPCSKNKTINDESTEKILKQFRKNAMQGIPTLYDIFGVVLNQWLKPAYEVLSDFSFRIFNHSVYFCMHHFLNACQVISPNLLKTKIVPLVLFILKHQSEQDSLGKIFIETFITKQNSSRITPSLFQDYLIPVIAAAIKTQEKAQDIDNKASRSYNRQFFINLKNSVNDLVSTAELQYIDKLNYVGSLKLLYKFCKYLDYNHFQKFLPVFNPYIDHNEDSHVYIFTGFVRFISDFLWNKKYCVYAAKIIKELSLKKPLEMLSFYSNLFEQNYSGFIRLIDNPSNLHKVVLAFLQSSLIFVDFYFKYKSPIQSIPNFIYFFELEYFPFVIFQKFKNSKSKWKLLSSLVRIALDLILCDHSFLVKAHENKNFVNGLISIIIITAQSILNSTLDSNILNGIFNNSSEQNICKLNFKELNNQLLFEAGALKLLHDMILFHLNLNAQPTYLYHALFNDKWSSELIPSFAGFLRFKINEKSFFYELSETIRSYSFDLIELMCTVGSRIGISSFEAYYPTNCQTIFDEFIRFNINDQEESTIRILNFIGSIVETQPTFAYNFIKNHIEPFLVKHLLEFLPEENNSPKQWSFHACVSNLLSKIFINLNSNSIIIQKLTYPEKGKNKQIAISSPIFDNLSPCWQKIAKFIFDEDTKDINENYYVFKVACKVGLLKALICILLNVDVNIENSQELNLSGFIALVFQAISEIKAKHYKINPRYNDIDLNQFKKIPDLNKYILSSDNKQSNYISNYFLDMELLQWYIADEDENDINEYTKIIQKFNKKLYKIHTQTELIATLTTFIHALIEIGNYDIIQENLSRSLDPLLEGISRLLENPIIPQSTIEAVFQLYEAILITSPYSKFETFSKLNTLICSANIYLESAPNSILFRVISELLMRVEAEDLMIPLKKLFFIACNYMATNLDENAAKCAIEISYVIYDDTTMFIDGYDILFVSFIKELINTPLAKYALIVTNMLCDNVNRNNENKLENAGLFDILNNFTANFINKPPPQSPSQANENATINKSLLRETVDIWPYIFGIYLSLDPKSPILIKFIAKNFHILSFFLVENPNNDIAIYRIQKVITDLIAHASPYLRQTLKFENPSTFQALIELIYIVIKSSYTHYHNKTNEKIENLLTRELQNSRSCCFLILHNCLYILNNLIDFPFGELPKGFLNSNSLQKMMDLLSNIIEDIASLKKLLTDKSNTDKYVSTTIDRSIEMAIRIFCSLTSSQKLQNQSSNGKHMKDTQNSVRAILDNLEKEKGKNYAFIKEMSSIASEHQ